MIGRGLALGWALAMLAGCTKVGTGGGEQGRHPYTHPHELRFAAAEDIAGLNPLIHASGVELYLAQLTMAYLIKTNSRGEGAVPELVTEIPSQKNGGISADGKVITFRLRKGVRWSDGAPFSADDVVFTTKQVLNSANDIVSRDGWDQIVKIDEPDKYTVVYHLKAPYSSFAVTFFSTGGANPAVLPQHLLKGYANLNSVAYNSLPVGIGPFKYESWKRADSVSLLPNPYYFRGAPRLQRIIFKIIPDRNVVLEQVRSHELDLWIPVSPHYYPELKRMPGIAVLTQPGYFFDHLDFHMTNAALRERAVRQALRYAIDRKTLNDKVSNGLYLLTESPVSTVSRFYLAQPIVPFDLAKANALLDSAGWRRRSDGIRAKGNVRLSFIYATTSGGPDNDTRIELMRGWWKQIGVEVTVKRYLGSQFFAPAPEGGIVYGGKFDIINFGWGTDPNEDLSNLYACYRFPPNGQNDMRWCDRTATAAMDAAKTNYDQAVRTRYIGIVQQAFYDQVPSVILDGRRELAAYNTDLKNWTPNPVAPFDDMRKVDI